MKRFPSATISQTSAEMCAAEILDVIPAVMRSIRAQMRGHSAALPSVVHFRALAYVNRQPDADISGVAAHIGLTLPSASKLVQTLLARGYIVRSADPSDRRRTILRPTTKGRKVMEFARRGTRDYLAALLHDCDAATLTSIAAAMRALRPIFRAEDYLPTPATPTPKNGRAGGAMRRPGRILLKRAAR